MGSAYARGYTNCAYYNRHASGDTTWFATKVERDQALKRLRAEAVSHGLSPTAAQSGIYPVRKHFDRARERDAYIENLGEHPDHEGGNYVPEQNDERADHDEWMTALVD